MRAFKSAIYGWSIVWKPEGDESKWIVDANDEAAGLPAIYEDWEMAVDRLTFLETKGVKGRMVAVLVHPADFGIDGRNKFIKEMPHPVDGWWPHVSKRKKRRKRGEEPDGPDA